jgi:hypothetical protein
MAISFRSTNAFRMVLILFLVAGAWCLVAGCLCPEPQHPPVCPTPVVCPPTITCPPTVNSTPSGSTPDFGKTVFFEVYFQPYEVSGNTDVIKYRAIINPDHSFTLKEATVGDFYGTWQTDTTTPVLRLKFNAVVNSISPRSKTGTIEFYNQNRASIFTPYDGYWYGYQATGTWHY